MSRVFSITWPRRRLLAAVLLLPLVFALFLNAAGADLRGAGPGWLALTLVASAVSALVLSSYLPLSGRHPELGCTPCGILAGLTVLGATMAMRNYGTGIEGPAIAGAITLFGLTQRLGQPASCPSPARV
jgi:hypothetical protein